MHNLLNSESPCLIRWAGDPSCDGYERDDLGLTEGDGYLPFSTTFPSFSTITLS
jgi:hypothetical protein